MKHSSQPSLAHGADDLLITSPKLPALPGTDIDTSRGKRTTQLDLNIPTDLEIFKDLVREADVFLQAYRPGALSSRGFGSQDLVKLRPGIVSANLCAWGWDGPWQNRRGVSSCFFLFINYRPVASSDLCYTV
jgi:hypothetical protein